jgi:hypothetical protein
MKFCLDRRVVSEYPANQLREGNYVSDWIGVLVPVKVDDFDTDQTRIHANLSTP